MVSYKVVVKVDNPSEKDCKIVEFGVKVMRNFSLKFFSRWTNKENIV